MLFPFWIHPDQPYIIPCRRVPENSLEQSAKVSCGWCGLFGFRSSNLLILDSLSMQTIVIQGIPRRLWSRSKKRHCEWLHHLSQWEVNIRGDRFQCWDMPCRQVHGFQSIVLWVHCRSVLWLVRLIRLQFSNSWVRFRCKLLESKGHPDDFEIAESDNVLDCIIHRIGRPSFRCDRLQCLVFASGGDRQEYEEKECITEPDSMRP